MKRPELLALTGARFYAAILVFLNHVIFLPGCEALRSSPVFTIGGLGVTFFFVLSGFILAYNYEATFRNSVTGRDYRIFLWDRFSKIYPMHLATLLLAIPVSMASPTLPLDWAAVPVQLGLIQCWMPFALPPYHAYLNSVSWSISCEAFFYVLTPVLIWLAASRAGHRAGLALSGALAVLVYLAVGSLVPAHDAASESYYGEHFAPVRTVDFAVGVCLGIGVSRGTLVSERRAALLQGLGIAWLVLTVCFRNSFPWWSRIALVPMPGVVFLILGLAAGRSLLARHLSHPWMHVLGLSSFAFYMIHQLVLRYLKAVLIRASLDLPPFLTFALVLTTFIAICAISCITYFRFEMPVQQALRRWMRRPSSGREKWAG